MSGLLGDVRLALRRVAGSPGLTLLIVATFALGIGANTAVFSLFDQILLRSMPVKDPGQLVILETTGPNQGLFESNKEFPAPISYPMFKDFRDRTDVFEGVLAYLNTSVFFGVDGNTERITASLVTGGFFDVLGLTPAKGRLLRPSDDLTPGAHPVVVLSYAYWQNRFGGDPDIVGKAVRINASNMEIVGVAPMGFTGIEVGQEVSAYVPTMMKRQVTPTWDHLESRRAMWLTPIARLKPGITLEQARVRADVVYKQILAEELAQLPNASARFRERFPKKNLGLFPGGGGASPVREQAEMPFKILLATAGLVLFIGCLNIANLLLTRATKRRKEIAVRLSLGGTRARLIRELVVEGAVLAGLGLIAGLGVAVAGGRLLVNSIPDDSARALLGFSIDARMLAFAGLLAAAGVVISSLVPALQGTRVALTPSLREGSGATAAGGHRTRNALVIGQLALSLSLLVGAGLLSRSLFNLASRPVGYDTQSIVTFSLNPALAGYDEATKRNLFDRVAEEIGALPNVASVAQSDNSLLTNSNSSNTIKVAGYTPSDGEDMNPLWLEVTPSFFTTLGAPLVAGRGFTPADVAGGPKVAVVNESFAKYFFKDKSAIGQRFAYNRSQGQEYPFEIIGVVRDFRQSRVNEAEGRRHIFIPQAQVEVLGATTFYVRAKGAEAELPEAIRAIVKKLDAAVPPTNFTTLEQTRRDSMAAERTMAYLASVFGGIALLLAALGLYGVLSHGVTQRFREIGVRVALGARPGDIVRLILGQAGRLLVAGLVLGMPVAWSIATLVRSELFGVPAYDVASIVASLVVLAGSAVLAAYLPAARAARVDPSKTLRYE